MSYCARASRAFIVVMLGFNAKINTLVSIEEGHSIFRFYWSVIPHLKILASDFILLIFLDGYIF